MPWLVKDGEVKHSSHDYVPDYAAFVGYISELVSVSEVGLNDLDVSSNLDNTVWLCDKQFKKKGPTESSNLNIYHRSNKSHLLAPVSPHQL